MGQFAERSFTATMRRAESRLFRLQHQSHCGHAAPAVRRVQCSGRVRPSPNDRLQRLRKRNKCHSSNFHFFITYFDLISSLMEFLFEYYKHVNANDYKTNLRNIVNYLLNDFKLDRNRIVFVTPPKKHDAKWALNSPEQPPTHFDDLLEPYVRACVEVCDEFKVRCLNFNRIMNDANRLDSLTCDGLHLSPEGGQLLFDN